MIAVVFISLSLLVTPATAFAEDSTDRSLSRRRAVLPAGQVVQGDYVTFGPRVVISGTVQGDVYVAGGRVLVDGVIHGDLIAVGAKVIVSGNVAQDARITGGHVVLSGKIGKNVAVGGADVQITDAASIDGNLVAAGGDVEIEGPVGRDAKIGARNVVLSNRIGGDLAVAAGAVRLTSKAIISGRLRYWADAEPIIEEGASVRGPVTHRRLPEGWQAEGFRRGLAGLWALTWIMSIVSTLVLGLVLLRIYPMFTRRVASAIRDLPWRSLGWGAIALVGIPILALVLVITLLGAPLGMIIMGLYAATVYIARIYAVTCFGQILLRRTSDSSPLAWSFVAGLGVYALLTLVPIVGEIVTTVTVLFGLGALLMTKASLVVALRGEELV
ncbi:hypothetical protein [Nitrospira sp. Nam80]